MVEYKWKYYIVLNNDKNDLVEDGEVETSDGLPLCSDYAAARWFDSPEELNEWVSTNTTLSLENVDYHIEGHYEKIRYEH